MSRTIGPGGIVQALTIPDARNADFLTSPKGGAIVVMLGSWDTDDRMVYDVRIFYDDKVYKDETLRSGVGCASATEGLQALLSYLLHDVERYDATSHSADPEDQEDGAPWLFPFDVIEWASFYRDDLESALDPTC